MFFSLIAFLLNLILNAQQPREQRAHLLIHTLELVVGLEQILNVFIFVKQYLTLFPKIWQDQS